MSDWLTTARDAYSVSTTYLDANFRKQWEDNYRHFQSKHAAGSKYLKDAYKYNSKIFRPKTRSAVRSNEAAAAAAFFANQDVVSIEPQNPSDDMQRASAEVTQQLLDYRLTVTIPWFLTCIAAFQESQVVGAVCSRQSWDIEKRDTIRPIVGNSGLPLTDEKGKPEYEMVEETVKDQPCIDLIPIENIRIHPGANWADPIGSSPFVIILTPLYAYQVKDRMESADEKTGQPKWKKYDDGEIRSAMKNLYDSTRQTRDEGKEDKYDENNTEELKGFDIVWCHENFIRRDGDIKVYWTLGVDFLLSDPVPIKDVYFHGEIPIILGRGAIEAHKIFPASVVEIGAPVQKEMNEIANQRLDNVKLVLNKRWLAKRNAQVDLKSITRNVAGSITLVSSMDDVKDLDFNDVTASSYQEQDRLNVDFDGLVGTFSPDTVQTNRKLNETVGGMAMLRGASTSLVEYQLKIFAETWVEPVLRQLVKLEQAYETDETVLAIAAEKAQLFQKYNVSKITDDLLNQSLTIRVNVGMGATDPVTKVQYFAMGLEVIIKVITQAPQLDALEVGKEVFGRLGYKDGERFFVEQMTGEGGEGEDPEKIQMAAMIQQMQQAIAELQQQVQTDAVKSQAKLADTQIKEQGQNQRQAEQIKADYIQKLLDLQNPVAGEERKPS